MQQELIFKSLNVLFEGNNDRYWVASDGTVWSNFNGTMKQMSPYHAGFKGNTYLKIDLYINGVKHKCRINRLISFAFTDNKDALKHPECYVSHHKNHNRYDNRLENLELLKTQEHFDLHRIERDSKKRIEEKFQLNLDNELFGEYAI